MYMYLLSLGEYLLKTCVLIPPHASVTVTFEMSCQHINVFCFQLCVYLSVM